MNKTSQKIILFIFAAIFTKMTAATAAATEIKEQSETAKNTITEITKQLKKIDLPNINLSETSFLSTLERPDFSRGTCLKESSLAELDRRTNRIYLCEINIEALSYIITSLKLAAHTDRVKNQAGFVTRDLKKYTLQEVSRLHQDIADYYVRNAQRKRKALLLKKEYENNECSPLDLTAYILSGYRAIDCEEKDGDASRLKSEIVSSIKKLTEIALNQLKKKHIDMRVELTPEAITNLEDEIRKKSDSTLINDIHEKNYILALRYAISHEIGHSEQFELTTITLAKSRLVELRIGALVRNTLGNRSTLTEPDVNHAAAEIVADRFAFITIDDKTEVAALTSALNYYWNSDFWATVEPYDIDWGRLSRVASVQWTSACHYFETIVLTNQINGLKVDLVNFENLPSIFIESAKNCIFLEPFFNELSATLPHGTNLTQRMLCPNSDHQVDFEKCKIIEDKATSGPLYRKTIDRIKTLIEQ